MLSKDSERLVFPQLLAKAIFINNVSLRSVLVCIVEYRGSNPSTCFRVNIGDFFPVGFGGDSRF